MIFILQEFYRAVTWKPLTFLSFFFKKITIYKYFIKNKIKWIGKLTRVVNCKEGLGSYNIILIKKNLGSWYRPERTSRKIPLGSSNIHFQHGLTSVILQWEETVGRQCLRQFALTWQILVIARVNGVLAAVVNPELQCEQGVFSPGDVGVDMDFVQVLREMREPLASDWPQVDLWTENGKSL